jgi:hypothetical protein
MINDAGKHEVKDEGFVAARRQGAWAPASSREGEPEARRRAAS